MSTYSNPIKALGAQYNQSSTANPKKTQRQKGNVYNPPSGTNSGQILGLLDEQRRIADQNAAKSEADREAALGLLGDARGQRSADYQSVFDSLSADPGDTPFANILRSSIQSTLENPDVFTTDQIANFKARSNEAAARAAQDAIQSTQISNAQRGIAGGVPQGLEQQIRLQASSDAIKAQGEIEFAASEARASNLAFAQQLGVNFETATSQARNQRLATLAQFVSEAETRDLELVTGMAEILANTVRENPDFSGYAAILSDLNRSSQDMLIQRENLAILEQQIKSQERLGLADVDSRNSLAQAQLQYNRTLSALQDQLADFKRQLAEVNQ